MVAPAELAALSGALAKVGWVAEVTVNQTNGHVVAGHLRIELALASPLRPYWMGLPTWCGTQGLRKARALAGIGLLRRNRAGHFALTMLVWVPLMGAGVIGGFVLAAVAGEDVLVAVPVLIGGLSVASAVLAVLPSARQAPERALKVIHHAVA